MKNRFVLRLSLSALALILMPQLWAQTPKALEVRELQLSNGMKVWLNEDHSQPKVFGAVVVQAGAKDCPNTGIAHYFEHIMFKGTEEIGTVDYEKEKPWLDSISAAYDRLAATTDVKQREIIQKDINRLSQKAGEYAIPNEFNSLISRYGGSELNAGTSFDFTFYHNMFTPQFMEQWCQLNSDRLINPVFRMFQGELETVYEEKNMGSDQMSTAMRETIFKELFGTQPYAYPVIGSTENLKNPKLSEMKKFYEQYYVGCNMGLVLSGDFDSETIMPLLERTFGRIPRGTMPSHPKSPLPDITQERTVELKIPLPLVSMEALVFKAPTDYERDANALKIATNLLSNGNAGMLDSLMTEGHMMAAVITPVALNDAGVVMMVLIPNLLAKTEKAEQNCFRQFKRIYEGDFDEKQVEVQKRSLRNEALSELETIDDRGLQMVMVMSSGHKWQEYMDKLDAIDKVTKADVMAAAKRYLDAPFVRFKKKFGTPEKDKVSQPGYTPVKPKNTGEESAYAKRLAQMPVGDKELRLVDFEKDAIATPLGGQTTLYTTKNPVNDLFELRIAYNRGSKADPRISVVEAMLNNAGTDSLSRQRIGTALENYGADITFSSDETTFMIEVTGIDKYFEPTMQLVGHFLNNAKADEKTLSKVKDAAKAEEKSLTEENTDVMQALMQKMMYGDQSRFLHRMTYKEVKKMTGEEMISAFNDVLRCHSYLTYSGTLDANKVASAIKANLPISRSQAPYVDYGKDPIGYSEPIIYVFDMPKARQTLVTTYDQIKPQTTLKQRMDSRIFNQYFGAGDMSSVLFQEVREFRSLAYSSSSRLRSRPLISHPNSPLSFITATGTQGDKSMKCIALVDSLFTDMPIVEKNFQTCRQGYINEMYTEFPSFRSMGAYVAISRLNGYTNDPQTGVAPIVQSVTMDDMRRFYETNIKNNRNHRVYGIVGNKKKLDLKELQKYGRVVFVKEKDLFRK